MKLWLRAGAGAIAAATLLASFGLHAHGGAEEGEPSNLIEALQTRLDSGAATLAYASDGKGYVPALLKAFAIPSNSQLLVFSGSSLQFSHINQKTPRAVYYQDDVSIGSVQGGNLIELIVSDKKTGVAFYTLETARSPKPKFERRGGECIICHGFTSRWAPGLIVATTETGAGGKVLNLDPRNPFHLTDQRTPFEQRYGGWYLTGNTGAMRHRGNVTMDPADPVATPPGGLNLASLQGRIEAARYMEPGSDVVALLTLEHQAGFINLITRINAQYHGLNNREVVPGLRATQKDIDASLDELTDYMRFADEIKLPSPVTGSSGFAKTFAATPPLDGKGRSLRQFELKTRLFRYPLSYMIYSQAFDHLNPKAKEIVLRRLYDALRTTPDGTAAINIAAATKKGLPEFWQPVAE
jgi:hypothetical protein